MLTAFGRRVPRLRAALIAKRSSDPPAMNRRFASSSAHHDDMYEAQKWEKITYVGIGTCLVLAIYNLSKGHRHYEEPPVQYPYMHIHNKEYPWGPDSLFETIKKRKQD